MYDEQINRILVEHYPLKFNLIGVLLNTTLFIIHAQLAAKFLATDTGEDIII